MDNFNNQGNSYGQNNSGNQYYNQQQAGQYQQQAGQYQQQAGQYQQQAGQYQQQAGQYQQQNTGYNNQQVGYNTQNQYYNQQAYNQQMYNQQMYNQQAYNQQNQMLMQDQMQSTGKKKKRKKKGGCLFGILKFLLIIILIIAAVIAFKTWQNKKKQAEELEQLKARLHTYQVDNEQVERIANSESDIPGKTVKEKVEMGLDPEKDSDTDSDGLTDLEEITVYNTDPLKVSSSGDGVPDGIKVAQGIDPTQKMNADEATELRNQVMLSDVPDNVSIDQTKDENWGSMIYEVEYVLDGADAVKSYHVGSTHGDVTIDFSEFMQDGEEYTAYIDDGSYEMTELKVSDGKVTFSSDVDTCTVSLVKRSRAGTFNAAVNAVDALEEAGGSLLYGGDALVITSPLGLAVGVPFFFVLESSLTSKDSTERTEQLKSAFDKITGCASYVYHSYVNPLEIPMARAIFEGILSSDALVRMASKSGETVDQEVADQYEQVMKTLFSVQYVRASEWSSFAGVLSEAVKVAAEDGGDNEEETTVAPHKNEKPSTYMSSFEYEYDAFAFPNFGSYVSPGGNCEGMALAVASVFNQGTMKDWGGERSYIEEFESLSSLFDYGLHDLYDVEYFDKKYDSTGYITDEDWMRANADPADVAFIDWVGAVWRYGNDNVETSVDMHVFGDSRKWEEIEKVMQYFADGNRICVVNLTGAPGCHAINGYGIQVVSRDKNGDPDQIRLLTYDNNFPDGVYYKYDKDLGCSVIKEHPRNYITITRKGVKIDAINHDYTYSFVYDPLPPEYNYKWDSSSKHKHYRDNAYENFLMNVFDVCDLTITDENMVTINKHYGE